MTKPRKLYNFPDKNIDRQVVELVDAASTIPDNIVTSDIPRKIYVSTLDPSGGTDGDIWIKYTP